MTAQTFILRFAQTLSLRFAQTFILKVSKTLSLRFQNLKLKVWRRSAWANLKDEGFSIYPNLKLKVWVDTEP